MKYMNKIAMGLIGLGMLGCDHKAPDQVKDNVEDSVNLRGRVEKMVLNCPGSYHQCQQLAIRTGATADESKRILEVRYQRDAPDLTVIKAMFDEGFCIDALVPTKHKDDLVIKVSSDKLSYCKDSNWDRK
jgi:hypothetical protein